MSENTKINVTNDTALITIDDIPADTGILKDIFSKLADKEINIDMISQTPPFSGNISLSFSLSSDDVFNAMKALHYLNDIFENVDIQVDARSTKITVYGEYMKSSSGVAAKLFKALSDSGISIKLITTSDVDISLLIYENDEDAAIEAIRKVF